MTMLDSVTHHGELELTSSDWPSTCESEAIEALGLVQPHGFFVAGSADWLAQRVSENIERFLGVKPREALGAPIADVVGRRALHEIRGRLQVMPHKSAVDRIFGVPCGKDQAAFDLAIHRVGESLIIEGEPHVPGDMAIAAGLQPLISQLRHVDDFDQLLTLISRQVRAISGFDRVMIYAFCPDGSGEVIREIKRTDLPPYEGLRFPASDIPQQARALYLRNPLRMIADVNGPTCAILPAIDPTGRPIDLSMSVLRGVSPKHIQYLKNMRVGASMSLSVVVEGRLWGLIACHHSTPRLLSLQRRSALEFFADMLSSMVETRLRRERLAVREEARLLHTRLLQQVSDVEVSADVLFEQLEPAQRVLGAHGLATFVDGRLRLAGSTPTTADTLAIMQYLNGVATSRVFSTACLARQYPPAKAFADRASGLLAIPVSRQPRDFVVFFRRELVREVVWAGEPCKAVAIGNGASPLEPRASFAAWRETVRGQSEEWTEIDLEVAEALRVTLLELILVVTDRAEKQRRLSNEQQDLLIAELNHRVRNILNLIVGLVRQCSDNAGSIDKFSEDVSTRIRALARAHDQLTSTGWRARSIKQMIRLEAEAYLGEKASRMTISGEDACIQPAAFATLALVTHELITNAAKYGAFRDSRGEVDIKLACDEADGLSVYWNERGGAPIQKPTRRGFGSTIIQRGIPHELGGRVELDFAQDGLRAMLFIPAQHVTRCAFEPEAFYGETEAEIDVETISGEALLVEDNLLIALETEDILRKFGAVDVVVASSNAAALAALEGRLPDFAVLDYNLGREQSVPVAERLAELGVPFMFATGYGDSSLIDARFRGRPILTKPYASGAVLRAYQDLMRQGASRNAATLAVVQ